MERELDKESGKEEVRGRKRKLCLQKFRMKVTKSHMSR
jgi:hypothetical protein